MPKIHALEIAERSGAERGADGEAREAISGLLRGDVVADGGAAALERLFHALAELLALPGDMRHASPDAKREYAALVRCVRRAVVEHVTSSSTAAKRARTYLEDRIIRRAETCGSKPSQSALAEAALAVIATTEDDVNSSWLVPALDAHRADLARCIAAAAALRPRKGRFVSPGAGARNTPAVETYETALRSLCTAVGLPYVPPSTRSPARSRARKRSG
ncbi:MAG: hypothetical protein ACRELB_16050 [Polyangiaceae bacterium]